jgi:signal peptidase
MFLYSIFYKLFGLYKTNYLYETKNTKIIIATDNIMEPDIKKNDIVILKKVDSENLKVGDIIYYKDNNNYKLAKIEAVKEEEQIKKSEYYITKGNKNYYYNQENANLNNIEGKVEKSISGLSLFFKIAKSNIFTIFVIIMLVMFILILEKNKKKTIQRLIKKEKRINK